MCSGSEDSSLTNKIISQQTAGMPSIDLEGDFYSLFGFYSPSQANKATLSPRVKMLWGSRNKGCSLELSLKLSFKRPREKYRLQRNLTRFFYIRRRKYSSSGAWNPVCNVKWAPEIFQMKSSSGLCSDGFSPGLPFQGREAFLGEASSFE